MQVPTLPPIEGLSPPSSVVAAAVPQQQTTTTTTTNESTINFDALLAELQSYKQQNNNNLTIPESNSSIARISDILTSLNMEHIMNQRWESQLKQLQEYKILNGHCNISMSNNNNNNIELAKWTAEQCKYYKLYELNLPNPLSKERYIKLKEMNLLGGNLWEARLMELRAYKAEHGHTDVPIDYPKLGIWVMNQRDTFAFNKEDMGERIAALNAISFNWNRWGRKRRKGREDAWELQYTNLLAYIKEHGNSNISQHDKNHEKLGKWIKNQRYEYKKYNNPDLGPSRLSRDRIEKLNECNFQWRLRPDRVPWEERYKALVQYKAVNGHTNVELGHELRKWVQYQRDSASGKKSKITQDKVDKLVAIGFEFLSGKKQPSSKSTVVTAVSDNQELLAMEEVASSGGQEDAHHFHQV